MQTIKEKITAVVQSQPEDSSYEEIVRELAFNLMIERGLQDIRKGNTITDDEMQHRIRTWQK